MTGLLARAAHMSAVLGLAFTALGATPVAAAPQPMGRCTTSSGVVLAVDFSRWGGPIYRSCGTTPTTGYELLNQGGWRTTGTGHDGPAFICRIGYSGHRGGKQFPTPDQDACVLTPPASAYWSYWHADPGENTWEYSQLGAMLYKPKPGSVDLWIFGGTDIEGTEGRPTVTPDQLRARNTEPASGGTPPGSRPTHTARPLPPGTDTGPAPIRTRAAPAPTRKALPPASPPSPTTSVAPTPSLSASVPPPSPSISAGAIVASDIARVVEAAPAADAEHDSGSFVPVVAGGALVVLIGGAAVVAAKRRRTEQGP